MTVESRKSPRMPPPWFIRGAWAVHRALVRLTFGRLGIWNPKGRKWGTLRLRTVGRRTGRERVAILGYYEDGPNLVTLAMNGWMPGEPAWWLNLQASPEAAVELLDGPRTVTARAAVGEERARLWAMFRGTGNELDALASRRPSQTAVVILEPIAEPR